MGRLLDEDAVIGALDVLCQEHRYRIPGKRETYSEYNEAWQDALDRAEGAIFNLPSAQSEPKEGEWVQIQRCARDAQPDLECPFCKHRIGWFDMGRYCARCGAKLKGGAG